MTNTEALQHAIPSGSHFRLRIADDHGPAPAVHRLHGEVDRAYKNWLRRRGLMDEEQQTRYEQQMAKARKVKAQRRACR